MARRRYQHGSVVKTKGKRKKWVLMWREDIQQPDGTITRKQHKDPIGWCDELTKPQARKKADMMMAGHGVNSVNYMPRSSSTFAEVAELWRTTVLCHQKEGTQILYEKLLDKHILPVFSEAGVDEIGNLEVQQFVSMLAATNGPKAIRNILCVLGNVCRSAVHWNRGTKEWNLDSIIIPPRKKPPRKKELSIPAAKIILKHSRLPFRAMFALGLLAALRAEEFCAIKIEDVDFDKMQITVRWAITPKRNLQSVKGNRERTVPMVPALAQILREHLNDKDSFRENKLGLVFSTLEGRPFDEGYLREDILYPLLDAHKLPRRGLHSFRHTATSLLLEEGVPLPLVQEIVGHSDPKVTLGI